MAEDLPANARMMSKAWSTNTLEAGKAVIEQQQVKEESDDEVKAMEAELEACTSTAVAVYTSCIIPVEVSSCFTRYRHSSGAELPDLLKRHRQRRLQPCLRGQKLQ